MLGDLLQKEPVSSATAVATESVTLKLISVCFRVTV